MSAQGLAAIEVPVEWHISSGIGHGIDGEGLRHGGEFLAKQFRTRTIERADFDYFGAGLLPGGGAGNDNIPCRRSAAASREFPGRHAPAA